MKLYMFFVYLFCASAAPAAARMARVVGIMDSTTIVVEADGRRRTVALDQISIPSIEEDAARAYLHGLIDGAWVYVEEGIVYRSPDGLYVNGEMQRHAWRTVPRMRYLGPVIQSPPSRAPASAARKAAPSPAAAPRATTRRSRRATAASRSRRQ